MILLSQGDGRVTHHNTGLDGPTGSPTTAAVAADVYKCFLRLVQVSHRSMELFIDPEDQTFFYYMQLLIYC